MIGDFNYLEDYLTDFYAEKHGVPAIKLDMTEIPRLSYEGLLEVDADRKEYIERITRKPMDTTSKEGWTRISVSCSKHGIFGLLIKKDQDPCNGSLRCPKCIQERILEIDQERHKRDVETDRVNAEANKTNKR